MLVLFRLGLELRERTYDVLNKYKDDQTVLVAEKANKEQRFQNASNGCVGLNCCLCKLWDIVCNKREFCMTCSFSAWTLL